MGDIVDKISKVDIFCRHKNFLCSALFFCGRLLTQLTFPFVVSVLNHEYLASCFQPSTEIELEANF